MNERGALTMDKKKKKRLKRCPVCNGTGFDITEMKACENCNGLGYGEEL
jgi:DnaJ-class molecular chaperone